MYSLSSATFDKHRSQQWPSGRNQQTSRRNSQAGNQPEGTGPQTPKGDQR